MIRSINMPDYSDCKAFMHPSGRAGFRLGVAGAHQGHLYDLFISPHEEERTAYDMVSFAIAQGADKLDVYEHPLLTAFFEQFGFQAATVLGSVKNQQVTRPNVVLMAFRLPQDLQLPESRALTHPGETIDTRDGPCARCGAPIMLDDNPSLEFGGYDCKRCGFIHVCGTLTLGPNETP